MDDLHIPFEVSGISRDRDQFLRELLRELAGVLEEAVGLEEAEGFVAMVGNRIGEMMDQEYRAALGVPQLDLPRIAMALVDLKQRIEGGFSIESVDPDRVVLVNTACPFGNHVKDRPSLCMMTSNVFGRVTANNLGYARVDLTRTIARGDAGCRVVIYLDEGEDGREYFG